MLNINGTPPTLRSRDPQDQVPVLENVLSVDQS